MIEKAWSKDSKGGMDEGDVGDEKTGSVSQMGRGGKRRLGRGEASVFVSFLLYAG
ncbi:MAG: hypothetical protein ACK5PQ_05160 [Alphaproteobacteria bacterium]